MRLHKGPRGRFGAHCKRLAFWLAAVNNLCSPHTLSTSWRMDRTSRSRRTNRCSPCRVLKECCSCTSSLGCLNTHCTVAMLLVQTTTLTLGVCAAARRQFVTPATAGSTTVLYLRLSATPRTAVGEATCSTKSAPSRTLCCLTTSWYLKMMLTRAISRLHLADIAARFALDAVVRLRRSLTNVSSRI